MNQLSVCDLNWIDLETFKSEFCYEDEACNVIILQNTIQKHHNSNDSFYHSLNLINFKIQKMASSKTFGVGIDFHKDTVNNKKLIQYINLKLAALGYPYFQDERTAKFLEIATPLLNNYREKARLLSTPTHAFARLSRSGPHDVDSAQCGYLRN